MTVTTSAPVDCAAFRAQYPEASHLTDDQIVAYLDYCAARLDEALRLIAEQGAERATDEPATQTAA